MVFALITAAARPEIGGQAIERRIRQGVQAFFEYQVPRQGFTIRVTAEEGRLAVCGSRTLQRPSCSDSSLYDWRREVTTSTAVYITPEGLDADSLSNIGGQVPANITMFVSFEGLVANNFFILSTTFADTRILQGKYLFGVILQVNLATVGSLYSPTYILLHVCACVWVCMCVYMCKCVCVGGYACVYACVCVAL